MNKGLLIRFLLKCFSYLPFRVCHQFGVFIGCCLQIFPNKTHKISKINLRWCLPELAEEELIQLHKNYLIEFGKSLAEIGPLWFWQQHQILSLVKQVTNEDLVRAGLQKKTGVILIAPHIGAWEIIGSYISSYYPMMCLYKPAKTKMLDDMSQKARGRFGAQLVPTDIKGVRALYQTLSQGQLISLLPDQDPGTGAGEFAPFFGHETNTMLLLPRLARKTQATLIFTMAERLESGRGFHIRFMLASEDIAHAQTRVALTALNKGVEDFIKIKPEQYHWEYKRFKTRPPGDASIYS